MLHWNEILRLYVITFTNTQIVITDVRIDIDKTDKHCYGNFVRKLCLLSIQKFNPYPANVDFWASS